MQPLVLFFSHTLKNRYMLALGGLVLLLSVFHLWSLMRYPGPFVDEAWLAARAWTFLDNGQVFGPLDVGVIDNIEGYWTFFPYLPTVFGSWGMWWFDKPSLWGIRIVSLVFGLILVGVVYSIGASLDGAKLGLLGAFLTGISLPFIHSAHLGRPDIYAAAFGFLGIALHLQFHGRRTWVSVVAGLCTGLAFEMHPNGAIFIPVIPLFFFLDYKLELLKKRGLWGYFLGVTGGLTFYLYSHVLPYTAEYFTFIQVVFGPTHLSPLFTLDLGSMLGGMWETIVSVIIMHPVDMLLIPWAVFVLIDERSKTSLQILSVLGVIFLLHGLLIRNKQIYYAILLTPAIALTNAKLAVVSFRKSNSSRWVLLIQRAIIAGVLISSIALNMNSLKANITHDFNIVQTKIAEVIEPMQSIMGPQTYWFEFYEHPYFSWENLIYYQRYNPGTDFVDALVEFHPDILIIDEHLEFFITDHTGDGHYLLNLQIPKTKLNEFLNDNAKLLTSIDGGHYGRVWMYKLTWDTN